MGRLTLEIEVDDHGQAIEASLMVHECIGGMEVASHPISFELLTIQVGNEVPSAITVILREDELGTAAQTKLLLENMGLRAAIAP